MSGPAAFPTELDHAVSDSIENIERGVRDFIFSGQSAAYRNVAVDLAKLLLDRDPKEDKPLFGLAFGPLKRLYVQSMKNPKASENGTWRDVGPQYFVDAAEILRLASGHDNRIPLDKWLDELSVRDSAGSARKTGALLKLIRNKEGAHSDRIGHQKDWRSEPGVAFFDGGKLSLEEAAALRYDLNYQQFVIRAGASLLYACTNKNGQWSPVIPGEWWDFVNRL